MTGGGEGTDGDAPGDGGASGTSDVSQDQLGNPKMKV
jgi:hypothetical protein